MEETLAQLAALRADRQCRERAARFVRALDCIPAGERLTGPDLPEVSTTVDFGVCLRWPDRQVTITFEAEPGFWD